MEHISLDKIHSYAEGQLKGDEAFAAECHLATCERCHRVFSGLKDAGKGLKTSFKSSSQARGKDCPEDWEIAALIRRESAPLQAEPVENHIKLCDFCLDRAAVYYKADAIKEFPLKTSEEWAAKAAGRLSAVKTAREKEGLTAKIYQFVRKVSELPAIPGYAAALAAAIVIVIWAAMPSGRGGVVTIPSTERLAFRESEAPSSLGFMGSERVEKFAGMRLTKKGSSVSFAWKDIPGAEEYSLSVNNVSTGEAIIQDLKSKGPQAAVPADKLKDNELYKWAISGAVKGGERFEYTGEFVLAK